MRSKTFYAIGFTVVLFIGIPAFVFAVQDGGADVDPLGFVSVLFSPAIAVAVGIIVGFTKMIRNMINLKGPLAVGLTFAVSIVYGFIQYNAEGLGFAVAVGVIAGAASTVGFWLTKLFGKKINPVGTN